MQEQRLTGTCSGRPCIIGPVTASRTFFEKSSSMSNLSRLFHARPAVTVTGIAYTLLGLALAAGGGWLAALGGSPYYLIAGLGILLSGALLVAGRSEVLLVYAAVL